MTLIKCYWTDKRLGDWLEQGQDQVGSWSWANKPSLRNSSVMKTAIFIASNSAYITSISKEDQAADQFVTVNTVPFNSRSLIHSSNGLLYPFEH